MEIDRPTMALDRRWSHSPRLVARADRVSSYRCRRPRQKNAVAPTSYQVFSACSLARSHIKPDRHADDRCPIIGSPPPEKSPPADNSLANICPAAGRIFTGKLLAGEDFSGGSYNGGGLFMGRRYFNKGETYQFRDYLSPGGFFFIWETFM